MLKISYQSLFIKLFVVSVLSTLTYVVCFAPGIVHAQTPSRFNPAEIVITNANTPYHQTPGGIVAFTVARGTLTEVQYFAAPEVVNGEVWRKMRVADGHYGYVRESFLDKYTGTIPTIWLEIDYVPSKVHLNYESRKQNFNVVINEGVNYINPNSDTLRSNDTNGSQSSDDEDVSKDEEEDVSEDEVSEEDDGFNGKDIVIAPRNLTFYQSAGGVRAFTVAKGTLAEILEFSTPQRVNGKIWHKLRVADGHWGYVTEDSIDHYTGTVPTIWRGINYQASKVHLNYEARKGNYDIVINQGVQYVSPNDDNIKSNDTAEEDTIDEVVDQVEQLEVEAQNRALMEQIIALLKQLIALRLQLMPR